MRRGKNLIKANDKMFCSRSQRTLPPLAIPSPDILGSTRAGIVCLSLDNLSQEIVSPSRIAFGKAALILELSSLWMIGTEKKNLKILRNWLGISKWSIWEVKTLSLILLSSSIEISFTLQASFFIESLASDKQNTREPWLSTRLLYTLLSLGAAVMSAYIILSFSIPY